jgi:YhcN/YlaJ family sporulation lipoprotein
LAFGQGKFIENSTKGQTKHDVNVRKERSSMKRWLLVTLFLSVFVGCNNVKRDGASPSPTGNNGSGVRVQQTAPQKLQITDPQAVADHLERLAMSVPQVQNAHCVVFGNTAVVGIDVKQDMDRSKIGTVKYSVAEALRKDPYGANAIVTADMDLDQRLREIRDNIRNGRPIAGFAEQMADIIGRIMPQLPSETIRPMPDTSRGPK